MRKLVKIIIPILIIAFAIYALNWFAVINVGGMIRKVPVVGKLIPADKNQAKEVAAPKTDISPMVKENDNLKKQISDLKGQLEKVKTSNDSLAAKNNEYQDLIKKTEENSKQSVNDQSSTSYKELSKNFADMKPDAAVQIMNNLDDETVIGILKNLENDQAGKILSAMDPKKAAIIVSKMT